jgi:hypothetical protein
MGRFSLGRPLLLGYVIHDIVLNNREVKRGSASLQESIPPPLLREGDKGGGLSNKNLKGAGCQTIL